MLEIEFSIECARREEKLKPLLVSLSQKSKENVKKISASNWRKFRKWRFGQIYSFVIKILSLTTHIFFVVPDVHFPMVI